MSRAPSEIDFDAVWSSLQETVHAIITLLPVTPTEWQHGFADVFLLCCAKPEILFIRFYAVTKQFLIDHVGKLFYLVQKDGDSQLIKNYYKYWMDYSTGSKYLDKLYHFFNAINKERKRTRNYASPYREDEAAKVPDDQLEIDELTLEVWRAGMIAPLGPKLVTLLLQAIDEDRRCQSTSLPVEAIRGTILSFVDVNIYHKTDSLELYKELFEEPYLKASDEHFKRGPARLFEGTTVSIYMEEIIHKIEEEVSRTKKFLHSSSLPKITHQIETLQQINSIFI